MVILQRIFAKAFWSVLFMAGLSFSIVDTPRADINPFDLGGSSAESLVDAQFIMSVSRAQAGKTYRAAAVVEIQPGWHINSARPYEDWLIPARLSFDTLPGITLHSISYPEGHDGNVADMTMSLYEDTVIIPFAVTIDSSVPAASYSVPVTLSYQPCNDRQCVAPGEVNGKLDIIVGDEGTLQYPLIFSSTDPPTAGVASGKVKNTQAGAESENSDLQKLINDYGFWGYFLALGLAFVTGLLLSFSPCTYPMIPITVSVFAGQQRSVGRGFVLSLFYVGSMAVMYGVMGLIVSLVGGVFGAWLASPPVVIGIAVVFVVFSLSMFGLYELNVPASLRNKLGSARTGGGVIGSMILGVVAALVISPCVGPFVAGILLYVATSGSPVLGFLVLFVFAVGLGTLYILIGTFSSALNALPNSGEWMEVVKKFFGFVLLLMALYFLRTIVSDRVIALSTGLILFALGVFGGGLDRLTPESGFFLRLKKLVGILALLVGGYLFVGTILIGGFVLPPASEWLPSSAAPRTESASETIVWETNMEAGLSKAKRSGMPVLIDTWASWCANCKVLEKKTFRNPKVVSEARNFVAIKVQLERSDSPQSREFMKRFGMKQYSLPTTVLLDRSGKVRKVIPGVVGPEELVAEMQKLL